MIQQGSDGLGRGLWHGGGYISQSWRLPDLFSTATGGLSGLPALIQMAHSSSNHPEEVNSLPTSTIWRLVTFESDWTPGALVGTYTLWLVPPSMAHQAMTAAVLA